MLEFLANYGLLVGVALLVAAMYFRSLTQPTAAPPGTRGAKPVFKSGALTTFFQLLCATAGVIAMAIQLLHLAGIIAV